MKNLLFSILLIAGCSTLAHSQVRFGAGLTYLNNIGAQVRAEIGLEHFDVEPKLSYYIVDDATSFSVDVDAAYDLINFGDDNPLYILAGPALYRSSSSGIGSTNFAYNLGAGLNIDHYLFELKYTTIFCDNCNGQIGGNLSYMF